MFSVKCWYRTTSSNPYITSERLCVQIYIDLSIPFYFLVNWWILLYRKFPRIDTSIIKDNTPGSNWRVWGKHCEFNQNYCFWSFRYMNSCWSELSDELLNSSWDICICLSIRRGFPQWISRTHEFQKRLRLCISVFTFESVGGCYQWSRLGNSVKLTDNSVQFTIWKIQWIQWMFWNTR